MKRPPIKSAMLKQSTLLILGAGASAPYGFPTAYGLRRYILGRGLWEGKIEPHELTALTDTENLFGRLLKEVDDTPDLTRDHFRTQFFANQFPSIDAFIQKRLEFERVGKLAIASILLYFERHTRVNQNWYALLLTAMFQTDPEKWTDNLKVVTFNYDRSFEFFFHRSFDATYPGKGREMLARVPICHVYGDLGSLEDVSFGDTASAERAAENIHLARETPECAPKIREWIDASERVWFLGFGFGAENMGFLQMGDKNAGAITASAYHLADSYKRAAEATLGAIQDWGGFEETIEDLICRQGF